MIERFRTVNNGDFWCVAAFTAAMPLPYRYGNLILIPLFLYWLAAGRYKHCLGLIKSSTALKLLALLFVIILLSLITSAHFNNQVSLVERYLVLIGFPLVFGTFRLTREALDKVLLAFVFACTLCAIYSLISTFFAYDLSLWGLGDDEYFSYYSWVLPETLNLKSNYYSLYVAFCLVITAENFFKSSKRSYQVLLIILFCFLFVFLGLLSSRTSFFAVILFFGCYLAKLMLQRKLGVKKTLVIGIIFFSLVLIAIQVPFLQAKIFGIINSGTQSDPRYVLFQCGWETFSQHFIFGAGIADVESLAKECYERFNDITAIENLYNFHNAFIEIGASTGIVGLLVLIALLIVLFQQGFKSNRMIHLGFVFLFSLGCMTESLLSRNKGIIFFTTFSTLLFILRPDEENTSR
jgi:O-antigen ligase